MKIDLRKYTPKIYISLEPGVYCFHDDSAAGKTYLSMLLRRLRKVERVDSITYVDDLIPCEFFDRSKRDLVMLDRYDLYFGQGEKEMWEFAKTGIVLVVCKSVIKNARFCPCFIERGRTGISVYGIETYNTPDMVIFP